MEKDLRDLIKNGFIVTTRNGNEYIRMGDTLSRPSGWLHLHNINPDLTNDSDHGYDIMSIHERSTFRLAFDKGQLIWSRNKFQVGDYVRLKEGVDEVRLLGSNSSDVIKATKPIFKVVSTYDNRIKVGCGIILDAEQFEKIDLYENE